MAHRELFGEKISGFHEFSGDLLHEVLAETALFLASCDEEYISKWIQHGYDEDKGHIIYLFLGE